MTPGTASPSIRFLPSLKDEALPVISLKSNVVTRFVDEDRPITSLLPTHLTSVNFGTDDSADNDDEPPDPILPGGMSLTAHPRIPDYGERYGRWSPRSQRFLEQVQQEVGVKKLYALACSFCSNAEFFLAPSSIPGAGIGLFTRFSIKKSKRSVLLYYSGEVLTEAAARERYSLRANQNFTEAASEYLVELSGIYIDAVDPSRSGAARYINHQPSGLANCKMNQYGGIIPIRYIPAHAELFYSYHGRWQRFLSASAVSVEATDQSQRMLNGVH